MFSNLLFPVDFSGHSLGAVGYVSALARKLAGKVTLLHALGDPHIPQPGADVSLKWWSELEYQYEQKLQIFGSPILNSLTAARLVRTGDPAGVITSCAAENSIDLIVMPTRGTGFRRTMLGSVTSKVLHQCPCPVWTMTHSDASSLRNSADIRMVLCAVDFKPEDEQVVAAARAIADKWNARICLVHAVPTPAISAEETITTDLLMFFENTARDRILALQKKFDLTCESFAIAGEPASVIREAAIESKANLVVIGRGHFRGVQGQLRSHGGSIIEKSPCPVLTL